MEVDKLKDQLKKSEEQCNSCRAKMCKYCNNNVKKEKLRREIKSLVGDEKLSLKDKIKKLIYG